MNLLKRILAAAAALLVAAPPALADVNIGISLSLTGPGSGLGIPMQNYYKLLGTPVIAGEKVNLIIADDASDPGKGVNNARRFVTKDHVDMIIGSSLTPVAGAMAQVAAEAKTVQLAASPVAVPPAEAEWVFRLPQSNDVMAYAMVEFMKKAGIKTVGFLGYTDAYGELWLKAFTPLAEKAGIKLVATERFARTDTSVTAQAIKLVGANPDAILIVASGSGAAMPQLAIVERGFKGKIFQTHAAATKDLMRVAGKAAEGTYVVSGPAVVGKLLPDSHPSKAAALDFEERYEKAYGDGQANQFAGHSYDTMIVLEKIIPVALQKAKPGTPEFRLALRDAMENMGRTVFSHGVMNWTKDNHWGYTNETGVMLVVKNGEWALATP